MDEIKTLELLKNQLSRIKSLEDDYDPQALERWKQETLMVLDNLIDKQSAYYLSFNDIAYTPQVWTKGNLQQASKIKYMEGIKQAETALSAIIFGIENKLI